MNEQQEIENQVVEAVLNHEVKSDLVPFWQPERDEKETYADYKDRRRSCNEYAKNLIKRGKIFHDSSRLGTYIKH
jgi:hypothetical protein